VTFLIAHAHELSNPHQDIPRSAAPTRVIYSGVFTYLTYLVEWWKAESDWDKFFSERLMPAFEKVSDIPQPQVTRFDVHSTYTAS
jgi:hypothetical protein